MISRRIEIAVAAFFAGMACASPVRSQEPTDMRKEMIGQGELATADRSKTCVVTMKSDAVPQGLRLELEPGCAAALPFTKDISSWSIKGLGDIVRLEHKAGAAGMCLT